jgi:hypothetical protein|tara:strand:+ start:17493 stop:18131 length:639 start_codon:yes stop_codon:yes gene_type:complete
MLISVCNNIVLIRRRTSLALEPQAPASSISMTSQPSTQCVVQINLSANTTGSITVTGSLGGSAQSETLNYASSRFACTALQFDDISTISCDSNIVSSGSTIEIKYMGLAGGVIEIFKTMVDDYPVNITRTGSQTIHAADQRVDVFGSYIKEGPFVHIPYTEVFYPKVNDLMTEKLTNEIFSIRGVQLIQQFRGRAMFWRCNMEIYEPFVALS